MADNSPVTSTRKNENKCRAVPGTSAWKGAFVFVFLALFSQAPARAADMSRILNIEAGILSDSNVSRTAKPMYQEADTSYNFNFSAGGRCQLTPYDRLSLTFDVKNAVYREYGGLNNLSAGLSASMYHKMGIGPSAPWVLLFGSAERQQYRENLRDGAQFSIGLNAGKRFNDWFTLTAGYLNQSRGATGNDVYSGNSYSTSTSAIFSLPKGLRLSVGYGLRRGDATAHYFGTYKFPEPSMTEETFGYQAYRRVFKTKMISATLSYPLGQTSLFYVGLERQESLWSKFSYPNDVVRAGVTRRIH